jgi:hypothetical protein
MIRNFLQVGLLRNFGEMHEPSTNGAVGFKNALLQSPEIYRNEGS